MKQITDKFFLFAFAFMLGMLADVLMQQSMDRRKSLNGQVPQQESYIDTTLNRGGELTFNNATIVMQASSPPHLARYPMILLVVKNENVSNTVGVIKNAFERWQYPVTEAVDTSGSGLVEIESPAFGHTRIFVQPQVMETPQGTF